MIGIHVRLQNIDTVEKLIDEMQIDCFQLFLKPKNGLTLKDKLHFRALFQRLKKTESVNNIYVHSQDNISLSTSKSNRSVNSWKLIREKLHEADELCVDGLIVHVNLPKNVMIKKIAEEMNSVFFDFSYKCNLLLENTTLKNVVGSEMSLFDQLIKELNKTQSAWVCLDTAHLFESGYLFKTKDEARELKKKYPFVFGKTKLVHLNDSSTKKGSFIDRHAHLGRGYIGLGALGAIVSTMSQSVDFITETPKCEMEDQKKDVEILRELVKGNKIQVDEIVSNSKIERVFYF
ncbi:MAG: TIM barrel protein [Caldisericia bacterium]|nr:TIM barrel protein [Caldisericia bacterium]